MAWYPIGPDFVFGPRRSDFKRLSRRNEWGRQGLVYSIAIDPFDAGVIYVILRPTSGGTSAFRTLDGGQSWKPIADGLQQGDPGFDPNCIAIDPIDTNIVYMTTWDSAQLVRSDDKADSWGAKQSTPARTRKLIIDPTTAGTPATTVIYAATDTGVYRSPSGGTAGSWTQVLTGDIRSLIAIFSDAGAVFYATVYADGIYRSTNPVAIGNWTNLNTLVIGLPAHTAATPALPQGNFNRIDVDFCARNPDRIYALFYKNQCDAMGNNCSTISSQLFTTSTGETAWTEIAMTSALNADGFYTAVFAVAPNSPGDGLNDILFFGNIGVNRSVDSGRNWVGDGPGPGAAWFHADQHAFAFFPAVPAAGTIPAMYIGNDGGLGCNTRFADPAFPMNAAPEEYNEGLDYLPNAAAIQNLNHGAQSSAIYQYTGEPTLAALGYIGCQDTGINSSSGALGWRAVSDADGGAIAVAKSTDGVVIWGNLGQPYATHIWKDTGGYSFPYLGQVLLGAGGPGINSSANFILGLDNNCLAGIRVLDSNTTLTAAIAAVGIQAATPASMSNIAVGDMLSISGTNSEVVTVTAVTATTFTANFTQTHAVGDTVALNRSFVVRMDHSGIASAISQNFGTDYYNVDLVARSPVNADLLAAVSAGNRLWITNAGSTADSTTVWNEATTDKPPGLPSITAVAIDSADNVYALVAVSVDTGAGPTAISSPLFRINGMSWEHQPCVGFPTGFSYGNLLADPAEADVLYVVHGGSVGRLTKPTGDWDWEDMSTGLPGGLIFDMWIADFGSAEAPNVIIRAAIPTRGVWETSPSLRKEPPSIHLYMRDNILDHALLTRSPDGVTNPFQPAEEVYHYQSVDVKVDVQQPGGSGVPPFFQITPEAPLPLNHVFFNELNDNSLEIPAGGPAYIHVQVHNRGRMRANNVKVWAIICNAAAGVPALNISPSMADAFPFWSQFTVTGDIFPNLPIDSPWTSVGPPVVLSGIEPASPQVASWLWTAPALPIGVEWGHHCVAVFVHSSSSPINEASMNVDEMAGRNKQVAQKNLHLIREVPASGGGGGIGGGAGAGAGPGVPPNYIEFHNSHPNARISEFVFDFTRVPQAILAHVQFSELTSERPLAESATGTSGLVEMPAGEIVFPVRAGCVAGLVRLLARLRGRPAARRRTVRFLPFGFDIRGRQRAIFPGITVTSHTDVLARMYIENTDTLEPGAEYRFDVLHFAEHELVGGCTYVIPVTGERKPPENTFIHLQDGDSEQETGDERPHLFVPPHVKHVVKARRKQMGRQN